MAIGRAPGVEIFSGAPARPCGVPLSQAAAREDVIFFDIDDTLVDQRKAEAAAAREVLAFYGHWLRRPYTAREFCRQWRQLRDKHNRAFFAGEISLREQRRRRAREFFAGNEQALSNFEADLFFDFYEHHYRRGWCLFDDVLPFFQALPARRFGVISNGSAAQQKLKLERTGIARYFEVVVVSEEIGAAKPDRDIFLAACRRAGAPAPRCIYVGDRLDEDARASGAAGLRSIWLNRRQAPADGAVDSIGSLDELRRRVQDGQSA